MAAQTINISLPKELVKKVDQAARKEFASRSDYIRQALVGKLKADQPLQNDWDLLEALSAEIAEKAARLGYRTKDDFVRVVKEVRAERLAKTTKR